MQTNNYKKILKPYYLNITSSYWWSKANKSRKCYFFPKGSAMMILPWSQNNHNKKYTLP